MKKLIVRDTYHEESFYRAEDVENLLRELTYVSPETGQLLTTKADVTDLVGPIIGYSRERRSGES